MRKLVLVLLAFVLLFCACKQDQKPADVINFKSEIPIEMTGSFLEISCTYKTDYFRADSSDFSKDLALLSFAVSRSDIRNVFTAMGFDTQTGYVNDDTDYNKCSYYFGHRNIDGFDFIAVSINWSAYGVEWAGNFCVGEKIEGVRSDHKGFDLAAEWVYDNLLDYIETNFGDNKLKIWISGYSRAAALTDKLACKVIENKELNVSQSNLFVYAFEPSSSIDSEYESPYTCIHNIVNGSDIVASMPPSNWNLIRPGNEVVNIGTNPDTLNQYLTDIVGEGVSMPVFTPDPGNYDTPDEFLAFFIRKMTEQEDVALAANFIDLIDNRQTDSGHEPISADLRNYLNSLSSSASPAGFKDRETFVGTVQDHLTYLLQLFMKDSKKGLIVLIDAIKALIEDKGEAYLLTLLTGDEFYRFTSDAFTKNNIPFDDEELKANCSLATALGSNGKLVSALLSFVIDEDKLNNIKYIVLSHYPEVIYALLKNY